MAFSGIFMDITMEQLLSMTQPMSKNIGQMFQSFTPCYGTTGDTLLFSPDSKELEIAPAYAKIPSICWHVKTKGKKK